MNPERNNEGDGVPEIVQVEDTFAAVEGNEEDPSLLTARGEEIIASLDRDPIKDALSAGVTADEASGAIDRFEVNKAKIIAGVHSTLLAFSMSMNPAAAETHQLQEPVIATSSASGQEAVSFAVLPPGEIDMTEIPPNENFNAEHGTQLVIEEVSNTKVNVSEGDTPPETEVPHISDDQAELIRQKNESSGVTTDHSLIPEELRITQEEAESDELERQQKLQNVAIADARAAREEEKVPLPSELRERQRISKIVGVVTDFEEGIQQQGGVGKFIGKHGSFIAERMIPGAGMKRALIGVDEYGTKMTGWERTKDFGEGLLEVATLGKSKLLKGVATLFRTGKAVNDFSENKNINTASDIVGKIATAIPGARAVKNVAEAVNIATDPVVGAVGKIAINELLGSTLGKPSETTER